jgi:hypothetical protein
MLKISYLLMTLIFLSQFFMYSNYSYYGYWTEKIINWLWLISTLLFIFWFWRKKSTRIYFFSLLTLIILSILPMAIPFFELILMFSTIDDYQQIKLNNTYRIERTRQGVLSQPRVYVYKKIGILEKNICRPRYKDILTDELNITDDENTPIKEAKLIFENNDSIGVEYHILDKKKLIYHKINNEDGY